MSLNRKSLVVALTLAVTGAIATGTRSAEMSERVEKHSQNLEWLVKHPTILRLLELHNQERARVGLSPSKLNPEMCLAAQKHAPVLHRVEQQRLQTRLASVQFVGDEDLSEQRTGQSVPRHADQIRRREVGRELHVRRLEPEHSGQRLDEQRLGDARHAFEQTMSLAEERDQQLLDGFLLGHDGFREFALHVVKQLWHAAGR